MCLRRKRETIEYLTKLYFLKIDCNGEGTVIHFSRKCGLCLYDDNILKGTQGVPKILVMKFNENASALVTNVVEISIESLRGTIQDIDKECCKDILVVEIFFIQCQNCSFWL